MPRYGGQTHLRISPVYSASMWCGVSGDLAGARWPDRARVTCGRCLRRVRKRERVEIQYFRLQARRFLLSRLP